MTTRLRRSLTYGNVTATLALFVALGGTGYAATQATRAPQARPTRSRPTTAHA